MPRKLWLSSLTSSFVRGIGALSLLAACENGGALDPFDKYTGNGQITPPPTSSELPACNSDAPTAACKIVFDDLTFMQAANCASSTADTTLGSAWTNPGNTKDHVQFGAKETSTTSPCGPSGEVRQCDMTLSNLPAHFASIKASKIKLTFSQKYGFVSVPTTTGSTLDGLKISLGVLNFGGSDVLTLTGSRRDSSNNLELAPISTSLTPGSSRSLTFSVRTQCYNTGGVPVYWYIEQLVAEIQP